MSNEDWRSWWNQQQLEKRAGWLIKGLADGWLQVDDVLARLERYYKSLSVHDRGRVRCILNKTKTGQYSVRVSLQHLGKRLKDIA